MADSTERYFSTALKKLREAAHLSQAELAQQIRVGQRTISNWETGTYSPKVAQVVALCHALKCSADDLLGTHRLPSSSVEEANGLQWRVGFPYNTQNDKEIEESVLLFDLMTKEQKDYLEIQRTKRFAGYSLETLRLLLRKALVSGVIQLVDVTRDEALEHELYQAFSPQLRLCFVANTKYKVDHLLDATVRTEAVAFLAAREALAFLPAQGTVGLTGGSTISRFIDFLPPASPAFRGISWVPLLVPKEQATRTGLSANSVITRLMYKQPGATAYRLSFVDAPRRGQAYLARAKANEQAVLERSLAILNTAREASVAFVSVGTPEFDYKTTDAHLGLPELARLLRKLPDARRRACVGDILLRLVDGEGNRLGNSTEQAANDALVYSISLEDLRRIATYGTVWALSARSKKAAVLKAGLVSKTINSLVIDTSVAEALLRLR